MRVLRVIYVPCKKAGRRNIKFIPCHVVNSNKSGHDSDAEQSALEVTGAANRVADFIPENFD